MYRRICQRYVPLLDTLGGAIDGDVGEVSGVGHPGIDLREGGGRGGGGGERERRGGGEGGGAKGERGGGEGGRVRRRGRGWGLVLTNRFRC